MDYRLTFLTNLIESFVNESNCFLIDDEINLIEFVLPFSYLFFSVCFFFKFCPTKRNKTKQNTKKKWERVSNKPRMEFRYRRVGLQSFCQGPVRCQNSPHAVRRVVETISKSKDIGLSSLPSLISSVLAWKSSAVHPVMIRFRFLLSKIYLISWIFTIQLFLKP